VGEKLFLAGAEGEDANVRHVAVALGVIEPEANDEFVGDGETDVVRLNGGDAPFWFVEQNGDAQMLGFALLKNAKEILHGHTGVKNVFDDEYGFPLDTGVEISREAYLTGGMGVLAVTRDGDEIVGDISRHLSSEIGEEEGRAFQNADQMDGFVLEVAADAVGEFFYALLDTTAGNENVDGFAGRFTALADGFS
jgi:hypothetical protein